MVPVPHESHGPRLHNFSPHAGAPCTVGEDALMGAHHPGEPCCLEWYPAAAILERMSGSPLLALTTGAKIYIFLAPWTFFVSRARPKPSGNKVNAEPPYDPQALYMPFLN